jgi:hypothetical protein
MQVVTVLNRTNVRPLEDLVGYKVFPIFVLAVQLIYGLEAVHVAANRIDHHMAVICKNLKQHRAMDFAFIVLVEVQRHKIGDMEDSAIDRIAPKPFYIRDNELHVKDVTIARSHWLVEWLQ